MKFWVGVPILLFSLMSALSAQAETYQFSIGSSISSVRVITYRNAKNQLEARLHMGGGLPGDNSPLIGFARDMNRDEVLDSWFLILKDSLRGYHDKTNAGDWRIKLAQTIQREYDSTALKHFSKLGEDILAFLTFTIDYSKSVQFSILYHWMEFEELRLRRDLEEPTLTSEQYKVMTDTIIQGMHAIVDRLEYAMSWGVAKRAGIDFCFIITGLEIARISGKLLTKFLATQAAKGGYWVTLEKIASKIGL